MIAGNNDITSTAMCRADYRPVLLIADNRFTGTRLAASGNDVDNTEHLPNESLRRLLMLGKLPGDHITQFR